MVRQYDKADSGNWVETAEPFNHNGLTELRFSDVSNLQEDGTLLRAELGFPPPTQNTLNLIVLSANSRSDKVRFFGFCRCSQKFFGFWFNRSGRR